MLSLFLEKEKVPFIDDENTDFSATSLELLHA
jgi:hypothetical protein